MLVTPSTANVHGTTGRPSRAAYGSTQPPMHASTWQRTPRAAAERGIRCHVDACIGGWVLPFARRIGRDVAPWTFAVDGVTSISVDLHKYAYTPKGVSVLLHASADLRRTHLFASARWPGYTMLNTTAQSTKSGGPVAAAWAVVHHIGADRYSSLARDARTATLDLAAAVDGIPGLSVAAVPDSTLLSLVTDDSCDVFTISDEMLDRGWFVQPQMRFRDLPATLHLTFSAATATASDLIATDLAAATAAARESGPAAPPAELVAMASAIDPSTLDEATFGGLLTAAGLAGGDGQLVLPERMAPVNALLDALPPELREALLLGVIDRLARPTP
jgi:hypothetical protein